LTGEINILNLLILRSENNHENQAGQHLNIR